MSRNTMWTCRCDCGVVKDISYASLSYGSSRSCGCLRDELAKVQPITHGHAKRGNLHPLYKVWAAMIRRCENSNDHHYHCYGGRGIKVCGRWRNSFENFLADVGERPSKKYSLDRYPNNDGDYEPGNVRWATSSEQAYNRRPKPLVVPRFEPRPMPLDDTGLIDAIQVATETGLTVNHVRSLVHIHQIPCFRARRKVRFCLAEVMAWKSDRDARHATI